MTISLAEIKLFIGHKIHRLMKICILTALIIKIDQFFCQIYRIN